MFSDFLRNLNPFGKRPDKPKAKQLVYAGPGSQATFEKGPGLTFQDTSKQPPRGFFQWLKETWQTNSWQRPNEKPSWTVAEGHAGQALGDLSNPDTSPENQARWRTITPEQSEAYIQGERFHVHSSNVNWFQFDPDELTLRVEYQRRGSPQRRGYLYADVSWAEMRLIVAAQSKGAVCWSLLLGRHEEGFNPLGSPRRGPKSSKKIVQRLY